ncbi:MAG: hypothetical protein A2W36_01715 [Chloroflexi bacterium RBG_16_58_14]|nr:MAG: hypothetical protein A2W36_01715 [Chloroflexi bacterium RBG_16_58_14]
MNHSLYRTQISLEPDQHRELVKIARQEKRSLSDVIREMLNRQLAERKKRELAAAAQALLPDYADDKELTAFTALDAEEFHA